MKTTFNDCQAFITNNYSEIYIYDKSRCVTSHKEGFMHLRNCNIDIFDNAVKITGNKVIWKYIYYRLDSFEYTHKIVEIKCDDNIIYSNDVLKENYYISEPLKEECIVNKTIFGNLKLTPSFVKATNMLQRLDNTICNLTFIGHIFKSEIKYLNLYKTLIDNFLKKKITISYIPKGLYEYKNVNPEDNTEIILNNYKIFNHINEDNK